MFINCDIKIIQLDSDSCLMNELAKNLWWNQNWKSGTKTKIEIKKCA